MAITINIDSNTPPNELHAIAALIAVLGGRAPGKTVITGGGDPIMPELAAPLAPAAPTPAPLAGADQSDGSNGPTPPAPPAPPSSLTVDSAGLPWDERIHSSSKETVADGTWRKKRGVDKALVPIVEAELRAAAGIVPTPPAPVAPPTPDSAGNDATAAAPTAPPAPVVTPVADAPAPPPPPPPPTTDAAPPAPMRSERFENMAAFATYVSGKGKLYTELAEQAKQFGKATFQEVTKDPSVWDAFCLSFGWVE